MNRKRDIEIKSKTYKHVPNLTSSNEVSWHTRSIEEVTESLKTNIKTGLSKKEAEDRVGNYGYNELEEKKGRTPFRIFVSQFNDFMIWILIAAAFVSGIIIREITDAIVILIILVINSVLGFVQEFRAEKALQALKELASPGALVIRDSQESSIYSKKLVPGDIIKLTAGDLVPADCRIIDQTNLQANESIITGESLPVNKNTITLSKAHLPIGDKKNMLFSGTAITRGRCTTVVIGTGQNTEIGKIASMIQEEEELTPLQIELKTVGKKIGIICLAVSAIVFLSGVLKDYSVAQMLLDKADSNSSKKTLTVEDLDSNSALKLLIDNAVLCNDAYYINKETGQITGDPTEVALIELGSFYSIDKNKLEKDYPRKLEEPFDSERKMMTTISKISTGDNRRNQRYILFSKGAPEVIAGRCTRIIKNGRIENLTDSDKEKIIENNHTLAAKAMRNLAFAFKYLDELPDEERIKEVEEDLVYLGMVGMIDPPRPEVYDAIEKCKRANIKIIMVTGDHKLTARAIGEELGILGPKDKVIDGTEFDLMTKEELGKQIEYIRIFARVSPSNKVGIVEALKKNQHIVAMTGDGINDAPSLKKADIGVAMGVVGTDVSKESSDMILTDDNFATIVKAVKQGRVIYDNLKKFILFLLSCNISEVLLMFICIVVGDYIFYLITGERGFLYIPLLPVQILWMNLITDGLPAMALGIDPPEKNIMDRKATKSKEQILSRRRLTMVLWQGLVLTSGALFIYFAGPLFFNNHDLLHDREIFQTSVFTTLVITQLLHTFNFRFENKGIFRRNIFENKYLNLAVIVSVLLQIGIIYIPWLQGIFKTASLGSYHWLLIIASSVVPVLIINFINEIIYKKRKADING